MRKLTLFCGVFFYLFTLPLPLLGQQEKSVQTKLDSVIVEAFRAGKNTPVTHSSLTHEQIKESSPAHSVPMILSMMPSVVSSTEGGNGLGYSSLRVRGSDASRINVTLNGVALNDAESQQVFWVNIPSFSSMLQDIQLQRGVGTSVNGPASFGASINMRTLFSSRDPYGMAEFSAGSYNTYMTTIGAGTGRGKNGLSADFRFSKNIGDGYIRNAKTNLSSLFASLSWYKSSQAIKVNYIFGDQKSGITWEGISRLQMERDRRYNPAGLYYDAAGNTKYYNNETDNYIQHHIQIAYSRSISTTLQWNSVLHFTKGDGYYENYKRDRKFNSYGLSNQIVKGVEYKRSDVIIRQAMDNSYTNFNTNLSYTNNNMSIVSGISYAYYHGDHFGRLLWSMYNQNIPDNHIWYTNYGYKGDFSAYIRAQRDIGGKLIAFADLQYRYIDYNLNGLDKDFANLDWNRKYNFINPKIGLTLNLNQDEQLYASLSTGRREPGRSDIKESVKAGRANDLKPERVLDYEIGYRFSRKNLAFAANIYLMEYKDQLVPTGKLSETGYVIKENVEESYRRGIELVASWSPVSYFKADANLTLSKNKINNYNYYIDRFNSDWSPLPQREAFLKSTDISFSPPVTGMVAASLVLSRETTFSLNCRYVGRQFLDNTSDKSKMVPEYYVLGLSSSKIFRMKNGSNIAASFFVDNLLNRMYYSHGWVYSAEFSDGKSYLEEGLYPQAGINFILKISYSF